MKTVSSVTSVRVKFCCYIEGNQVRLCGQIVTKKPVVLRAFRILESHLKDCGSYRSLYLSRKKGHTLLCNLLTTVVRWYQCHFSPSGCGVSCNGKKKFVSILSVQRRVETLRQIEVLVFLIPVIQQ